MSKTRKEAARKRRPQRGPTVAAPPEALLGYRLWQVTYAWHRHIERELDRVALTHLQYVLLAAAGRLAADGAGPSQSRLAAFTKIEKMMVSKNLRALEERGLVVRRPRANDRRANEIGLTPRGRRTLTLAFGAAKRAHRRFFGAKGFPWRRLDRTLDALLAREE